MIDTAILNPCRVCGQKPIQISNGYGRHHTDLECQCGQRTNEDFKPRHAIKAWNAANPLPAPPGEGRT